MSLEGSLPSPDAPPSPSSPASTTSPVGPSDPLAPPPVDKDPLKADDPDLEDINLDGTPRFTSPPSNEPASPPSNPTRSGADTLTSAYASIADDKHKANVPDSTADAQETQEERLNALGIQRGNTSVSSLLSTEPAPSESASSKGALVFGVCLVGFDHAVGPTVEYCYPEELNKNSQLLAEHLPFFALPDGAHARDEDYSYFHLSLPSVSPSTIFGISCNRQISSSSLLSRDSSITRSTVQKAIVVLASKPIFGPLRDKLGVITRAFFAQKDFADKSILRDLWTSLETLPSDAEGEEAEEEKESKSEEGEMYMGTSLRELVYKFRFKTLMLLKLLMLQRKVMFYGAHTPVELLCTFQYSLVALIPALLTHLEDAATPALDARAHRVTRPQSLRTSDKNSLIRYLGLPLNIFGAGAFFQPYLPLQQIDMLRATSYLVGTTNSIFQQQRDCQIDVLVNVESATLDFLNPKLTALLTLTAADRKWMDEIVTTVDNSWNAADPSRPIGGNFIGSDDFLRAKFEEYICSMLACIKFEDFLKTTDRSDILLTEKDLDAHMSRAFNEGYIRAFRATPAFTLWNSSTDSAIFDLVEPRHPMEGKTNAIEDVGIRLAHGLHDLRLEENLAPTREAITRGVTTGSDALWKTYSFLRTETSKRQTEFQRGELAPPPILKEFVGAGVDGVKSGAAGLASGLGSLWGATAGKRAGLFGRASGEAPESPISSAPSSRPVSTSGYPPLPATTSSLDPSPPTASTSRFRPLSTASAASVPVTTPENGVRSLPPAAGLSAPITGFFTGLRSRVSSGGTPPPLSAGLDAAVQNPGAEGEEGGEEIVVRDLDKEYAEEMERRAREEEENVKNGEYPPSPGSGMSRPLPTL